MANATNYCLTKIYKENYFSNNKKNINVIDKIYRIKGGGIQTGYVLSINSSIYCIFAKNFLNRLLPGIMDSFDGDLHISIIDEILINTMLLNSVNTIEAHMIQSLSNDSISPEDLEKFLDPNIETHLTEFSCTDYYITVFLLKEDYMPITVDAYNDNKAEIFRNLDFYHYGSTLFDDPAVNSKQELFNVYANHGFTLLNGYIGNSEVLDVGEIGLRIEKSQAYNMHFYLYLGEFSSQLEVNTRFRGSDRIHASKQNIDKNHSYLELKISKRLYGLESLEDAINEIKENPIEHYIEGLIFRKSKLSAHHNNTFFEKELLLNAKRIEFDAFNSEPSIPVRIGRTKRYRSNITNINIETNN